MKKFFNALERIGNEWSIILKLIKRYLVEDIFMRLIIGFEVKCTVIVHHALLAILFEFY